MPLKIVGAAVVVSSALALFTRRFVEKAGSEGVAKVEREKSESNDHLSKDERILTVRQGTKPR
jgi:hypothetical protein